MKISKLWTLLFFASILSVSLSTHAAPSPGAKDLNKELKIGMTQEFDSLNPIMTNMLASHYLLSMVSRRFIVTDKSGELVPQIVESIPSTENGQAKIVELNGQKKVKSVWQIKKSVKWGDGRPVTCHDFAFAKDVAISGKVPAPNLSEYEKIEKIEIDKGDAKKCTITSTEANWNFFQAGMLWLLPQHIEKPVFDKFKDKPNGYTHNSLYVTKPATPGLYMGPYVIKEIVPGSHVALERNPYFYGKKPAIEKVIVRLIPNTATLEANLLSGTIDMISTFGMTFDQALKFDKKVSKENLPYEVQFKTSYTYEHIDINLEDKVLSDINVRKALRYATDLKAMSQALFDGKQPPALHFISPNDPWFTDDSQYITKYSVSLRKARKLLEKSGWELKEDGYRYKDGKKLQFTIMSTSGRKLRELVQVYLQGQWKQVGIDLQVKNFPARVFFGEYTRQAKFPHFAMYSFVSLAQTSPKQTYHSAYIPRKENNFSGTNRTKWKNKKVDQLFEEMDKEFVHEKRKKIMAEILKFYTDEVPALPMFYRSDISVVPKKLQGYFMTGNSFTETNFIENWSL